MRDFRDRSSTEPCSSVLVMFARDRSRGLRLDSGPIVQAWLFIDLLHLRHARSTFENCKCIVLLCQPLNGQGYSRTASETKLCNSFAERPARHTTPKRAERLNESKGHLPLTSHQGPPPTSCSFQSLTSYHLCYFHPYRAHLPIFKPFSTKKSLLHRSRLSSLPSRNAKMRSRCMNRKTGRTSSRSSRKK